MPAEARPFDPASDYPVGERRPDLVISASGRPAEEITVEAVVAGEVTAAELRITPAALERQALVAEASGRPQLGPNFRRAAELTRVPDERLLAMYEALRPDRSTAAELEAIAVELEMEYAAPLTAELVREAVEAYGKRGVLRRE